MSPARPARGLRDTVAPMGGAEAGVIGAVGLAIVVQLAVSLALFAWGRWVARRHGTAGWRRAAWMPLGGLVLAVVGMAVTAVLLVGAFSSIASVDPSRKAAVLAEHISEAMNATALLGGASALLYAASFVAFGVGSLMRPHA